MVNETHAGLLGLGPKLVGEAYSEQDKELLLTFVNNLVVAVRSAISFEDIKQLNLDMQEKHNQLENAFNDLDRRVYHLKTLNDVSKDIFGSVDFESILKNFLLMSMGNFGVFEGFILTLEMPNEEIAHFESNGYEKSDLTSLQHGARELLLNDVERKSTEHLEVLTDSQELMPNVACGVCFSLGESSLGFMGLGAKLIGEPYNEDDQELLVTLVNNLVVALKNAISFENIKRLNLDLQEKNLQLEMALKKVELLESIKSNLSKFVPNTVTQMIEKSPTAEIPEAKNQDVSVLFLDIEGYTKLSERLDGTKLNDLIEKYFSVFMEAIHSNNGDVNETAGDGLMVIYHSEDETTNALEAVRTALMVREKATLINNENDVSSESLVVNMGINSGRALLGAARFDSYTGSRWTYTARGMVTNVAARIGAQATEGGIFLSKSTAERIKDQFKLAPKGKFNLKNVSEEVEVFSL
jgi:class 3 adenylate cyclase